MAVLPFENLSGDPGEEYFSDGLTEELIAALSRLQSLRVVARTSVFAFKGQNRDVREIGQALNVAIVVEGSVRRQGDRLRVTAQLVNAADGFHIWSATYEERRVADVLDIQRDVALRIAGALDAELTPRDRERLARRPTENPDAHVLFLKGRYFLNKRTGASLATAIEYLERAIASDPRYARAHAELAGAYAVLGVHDHMAAAEARKHMQQAALRATELDPDLAEARAALGSYRQLYEWDWVSAEREFRRAIALDPGYAAAHLRYGFLLESLGRFDEAVAEIGIAQQLDPLATAGHSALGFALFLAGHADQALEHVGQALELDATDWMAHSQLGQIEEALGDLPAAIRAYQRAVVHSGAATKPRASLARVRALSGREDEARRMLAGLVAEAARTGHTPVVATVMLALGDRERAIRWLENAYRQRHPDLLRIPADPRFAALRDDRRFLDLLARIGLPPGR
ncbi:MAG TPA: tetratricopeptide repeat protein [Gemmatimonadales bacterium]|nr:tetratricopeptide repeat protein [Gemmatimonadales bacterium]